MWQVAIIEMWRAAIIAIYCEAAPALWTREPSDVCKLCKIRSQPGVEKSKLLQGRSAKTKVNHVSLWILKILSCAVQSGKIL